MLCARSQEGSTDGHHVIAPRLKHVRYLRLVRLLAKMGQHLSLRGRGLDEPATVRPTRLTFAVENDDGAVLPASWAEHHSGAAGDEDTATGRPQRDIAAHAHMAFNHAEEPCPEAAAVLDGREAHFEPGNALIGLAQDAVLCGTLGDQRGESAACWSGAFALAALGVLLPWSVLLTLALLVR